MSVSLAPTGRPWLAGGAILILVLLAAFAALALHGRPAAPSPAPEEDASARGILLALAQTAEREHRLLAPAGSNAYEFYLSVLGLEPDDADTREVMQRLFPVATREVEQTIDNGELDEAERELRLLRDFDQDNYLLALLAGKLAAQRQVQVRQHEARAAILQARLAQKAAQPDR